MPTFDAPDGTLLAYRTEGRGRPVLCVPGGPADSAYLGDLGGLSRHRQLIVPDLRGTGASAAPADPASYRCDRQVGDIEALRVHLGLDRVDLLGHSAGANLAVQYAARHPQRVARLALITPGPAALGVVVDGEMRRTHAELRKDEPWFPDAFAALEALIEGRGADWDAIAPFFWGRWDAAARELYAAGQPRNMDAVRGFSAEGAYDPPATRAALAAYPGPVLALAGEFDLNTPPPAVAEIAAAFPHAEYAVQPGAGHYPWVDDPEAFTAVVAAFLGAAEI
ncbi:alpha/beta fold hydrolase [Yinghuangia soli]|uniref:Alpha/beta hydrolase n=1 Tax=Yinghuangia soli TaxID=2908204 RepID=A0AA41PYN0_9ACTN|nr:alpha/beta hydrolase [Yinghuangia soli]MCF2527780.1 alpha/beta hydrolase [Yinghuangia soli]